MMTPPHPFQFFSLLKWLDGRPLMDVIEGYRRAILERVLFTFEADASLQHGAMRSGQEELENVRPNPGSALSVSCLALSTGQ
jgi:hypothetical protein